MKAIFKVYRDRKKEWRWKLLVRNNRKIANAGEGYKNRKDCVNMIHNIIMYASTMEIEE